MRLAWIWIVCVFVFVPSAAVAAPAYNAWGGHQGYDTASSYCVKCHGLDGGSPDQFWAKTREVSSTCQTCHSPFGAVAAGRGWTANGGEPVAVTGSNTPVFPAGTTGFSIPQDGRPGHQLSPVAAGDGAAAPEPFKIASHGWGAASTSYQSFAPESYCSTCHLSHAYSTVDSKRRSPATVTSSAAPTSYNSGLVSASYAHASEGDDGYCISCHYSGSMP